MKFKFLSLILLIILCSVSYAQETGRFVDIKKAENQISVLEAENKNHEDSIADNGERKAFLENRITESENRITQVNENLDFAKQKNLEVNKLNSETQDRKTKEKIDVYRDDIVSLIWLLKSELKDLDRQIKLDKEEVAFIEKDSARRERLIDKNNGEISSLKQDIARTESKNSEISTTLDTIKDQLVNYRSNVTTDPVSVN